MITVVSICLNNENDIEKTIKSVIKQKDVEIEHIIKDGCSHDSTNQIVRSCIEECDNENIHFNHIISEDSGIYNAMNQAINEAAGEWMIFMNAGDYFYDSRVLKNACSYFDTNADVLYGDTLFIMSKEYLFPQIHHISKFGKKYSLGHQSCLLKTELMKKYHFNEEYKIAGDYDQLKRLLDDGYKFQHMNMLVAVCNRQGISCQRTNRQFEEVYKIQYPNQSMKGFQYKKGFILWNAKKMLIKMFPSWEAHRYCKNNMKRDFYEFD